MCKIIIIAGKLIRSKHYSDYETLIARWQQTNNTIYCPFHSSSLTALYSNVDSKCSSSHDALLSLAVLNMYVGRIELFAPNKK